MFTPTREDARRFLVEAWRKYRTGEALSGLEATAVPLIAMHPEYHAMLDSPRDALERDFPPGAGVVNPFLHLSLHLAVAEQLAIDQPPGIRAAHERLLAARGDPHAAAHAVIDCLAEVVWQAQRSRTAPDASRYLRCLEESR